MIRGSAHDSRNLVRDICLDVLAMILADRLHGELPAELHAETCFPEGVLQASFDTSREERWGDTWPDAERHQNSFRRKSRFQEPNPVFLPAFGGRRQVVLHLSWKLSSAGRPAYPIIPELVAWRDGRWSVIGLQRHIALSLS